MKSRNGDWLLLRLELRQVWRDRTVPLATALLALVVVASVAAGAIGHRQRRAAADELVDTHRSLLAAQAKAIGEDRPRVATAGGEARRGPRHPGLVLIRVTDFRTALPPSPHASLAGAYPARAADSYRMRAFDDEFVSAFPTVGDKSLSGLMPERPLDPPEAVQRGPFSLSFVLIYLVPVLLAATLFDVVAGERESGTLALAAAQPVDVRRWLALKLAARAGPIWVAGLLVPLGAVGGAAVGTGETLTAVRVVAWIGALGLYLVFWTAVAAWTSAAARSSMQAGTVLAAIYLIVVVGLPAVADLAARTLAPLPSRAVIADRERDVRFATLGPISSAQQQIYDVVRARFPYTVGDEDAQRRSTQAIWETPAVLPRNPIIDAYFDRYPDLSTPAYTFQLRQILHRVRGEYIEAQLAPLLSEFDRLRRSQRSIVHGTAWVSPALAMALALDELAGVSETRRERYLAQLDGYVRAWYDAIYGLLRRNRAVTPELMRSQQPFTFVEEPDASVVARVLPLLGALVVAAAVSSVMASRQISRATPTS